MPQAMSASWSALRPTYLPETRQCNGHEQMQLARQAPAAQPRSALAEQPRLQRRSAVSPAAPCLRTKSAWHPSLPSLESRPAGKGGDDLQTDRRVISSSLSSYLLAMPDCHRSARDHFNNGARFRHSLGNVTAGRAPPHEADSKFRRLSKAMSGRAVRTYLHIVSEHDALSVMTRLKMCLFAEQDVLTAGGLSLAIPCSGMCRH